jgi:hypothetical protein
MQAAARADSTPHAEHEGRFRTQTAFGLLLGGFFYILGGTWDIQWHADVGPDSFFTAPHSVLYGGITLAGIVALIALIRTTLRYRSGAPAVTAQNTVSFLGIARAPQGVVIGGLGAVAFITAGLFDLWWHTLYGFDVTLASPPHVMLITSGLIVLSGAIYLFGAEVTRIRRVEGRKGGLLLAEVGFLLAMASLLTIVEAIFLIIFIDDVEVIGPFAAYPLVQTLFQAGMLAVAASFIRRPGAGLAVAAVVLLWRGLIYLSVPDLVAWLSQTLALGYKARPVLFPLAGWVSSPFVFLPALVVDLGLWVAQQLKRSAAWLAALAAMIGAALQYLVDPRWLHFMEQFRHVTAADKAWWAQLMKPTWWPTLLLVPVVALVASALGWRFGQMLRYQTR